MYVDDSLCISHNAEIILREELGKHFVLKESSIGPPKIYLGNKLTLVTLENGTKAWSLSSSQYVQAAIKNVEEYLKKKNLKLPRASPFPPNSRPELDTSLELNSEDTSYYQCLIGVLRWIVELGRIDIVTEASIMTSQYIYAFIN